MYLDISGRWSSLHQHLIKISTNIRSTFFDDTDCQHSIDSWSRVDLSLKTCYQVLINTCDSVDTLLTIDHLSIECRSRCQLSVNQVLVSINQDVECMPNEMLTEGQSKVLIGRPISYFEPYQICFV